MSKLTHQENHIADAIYFLTAQQISARWTEYKDQRSKKDASTYESGNIESDAHEE